MVALVVMVVVVVVVVNDGACTPQFCVPQPRCHEASLVRGPHQHYLRTLQNRTPACQDKKDMEKKQNSQTNKPKSVVHTQPLNPYRSYITEMIIIIHEYNDITAAAVSFFSA